MEKDGALIFQVNEARTSVFSFMCIRLLLECCSYGIVFCFILTLEQYGSSKAPGLFLCLMPTIDLMN